MERRPVPPSTRFPRKAPLKIRVTKMPNGRGERIQILSGNPDPVVFARALVESRATRKERAAERRLARAKKLLQARRDLDAAMKRLED